MGQVTLNAMSRAFGTRPEDVQAAIGPSICQSCYEVSEEVAVAFSQQFTPDEQLAEEYLGRYQQIITQTDINNCLLQDKGRFYMIHRPFRLTEILTKMSQYKIEPKRIQFVHPYLDKEPTMVLVEGMRGAKPRVKIEPPLIMYSRDGGLRMENGYGHTGG